MSEPGAQLWGVLISTARREEAEMMPLVAGSRYQSWHGSSLNVSTVISVPFSRPQPQHVRKWSGRWRSRMYHVVIQNLV
jgi:hypothetical protein